MKYLMLVLIGLSLSGCAAAPVVTMSPLGMPSDAGQLSNQDGATLAGAVGAGR
jgi:hypothetical protein